MLTRGIFLTPILLVWLTPVHSQAPALYFEKISVQNGLSHNKVNCILQDKRNFIWIGTDDGLNRFDGYHFTIFRNDPENKTSISGNIITGLLEDKDGILWITTSDGGLARYDYRQRPDQQFTQFKHLPGDTTSIPVNTLNTLIEDTRGRLWLGSSNSSIIIFDKQSRKFFAPPIKGPKVVLSLTVGPDGKIWAGRQGGSIIKINPFNLQSEADVRYDNLYAKLPHSEVSSLFKDRTNFVWFSSWDRHLYRTDGFSKKEQSMPANKLAGNFAEDEILSFSEDSQGLLWMGGHYNGLQVYDPSSQHFYQYQYDPSREGTVADNRINCIYRDKNGLMWVGTNKGVSISNPIQQQFSQQFLQTGHSSQLTIYTFYENEKKDLLLGTSNGLYIKKNGTSALTHVPLQYKGQPLSVTKFFKDGNQFYLGTNYTLFKYDLINNVLQPLPNTEKDGVMNQLIESRIVSVIKDSIEGHPVLITSPYGHYITYYDLVTKKWVSRLDSVKNIIVNFKLKDNLVHKFYKTSSGDIWLANAMQGLGEWDKKLIPQVIYYTNNPQQKTGLSNNHVYDITEDATGNLWISTLGGGLHYMNTRTKEITHIPNSPNLLEGLQLDGKGNVWMISNGELYKYDPVQKLVTPIILPDVEKSGGIAGYIFKDGAGKMYVSGINYYVSFHPDSIKAEQAQPKILFTDFQIFGSSYSHLLLNDKIVLPYYQHTVSISFAAPSYTFSEPLHFSYKLIGINKDWIQSDLSNIANYANLSGGDYTFLVKMNNTRNGQEEVVKLLITIVPPYWKRWWFYALCAVLLSFIIWIIYRYRINEILKRQAIRNKIAQDLHDSMGSALSSISIYGRVAQIQHNRNEQTRLKEVLEKITATSSDVISEMNDIVWAINPRNDDMEKIIQRMESYAKPLASAENIAFEFTVDKALLQMNLSMEKRKNFYLIFKEAFNNAVKYSSAKKITTRINVFKNRIAMSITDDGKGFDDKTAMKNPENSSGGNGLTNMVMRAKEMKGDCVIQSSSGNGTEIKLEFPA